jgi:hypothetical protein
MSPLGEVFQDCFRIVTECSYLDALTLKSRFRGLQLDQLLFAVRSPIGGTNKQKNRSLWPSQRIEGLLVAKLIAGREGQGLPAGGQPNLCNHIEGSYLNDVVAQRALNSNDFAQVTHRLTLRFEMVDFPQRIVIQGEFRGRVALSMHLADSA